MYSVCSVVFKVSNSGIFDQRDGRDSGASLFSQLLSIADATRRVPIWATRTLPLPTGEAAPMTLTGLTGFTLKSSVSFPKQRCLSHAETQRRGDSANMWRFAARFSLHPFGEESILSFRFPNFARTCKMPLFSGLSLRSLRPQRLCVRTQTRNLGSTYIPLLGFLAEPLRVQRTGGTTSSSLPVVSNPHVMRMGEKHRCSLL